MFSSRTEKTDLSHNNYKARSLVVALEVKNTGSSHHFFYHYCPVQTNDLQVQSHITAEHFTIPLGTLKWIFTDLFRGIFFASSGSTVVSHMPPKTFGVCSVEPYACWSRNMKIFIRRYHSSNKKDAWRPPENSHSDV